jgi:DeoR family transcriptional regulator of aga operon
MQNLKETPARRAKILGQLEENGQLNVKQLSSFFGVSEVTIRNDLAYLENNNLLLRTRGGALRQHRVGLDFKLTVKSKQHQLEKQKIGKKAVELIKDGDTIILDSGTTTGEIAKNLTHFNELTVITNALNIAGKLADSATVKIIMVGGYLRENSLSLVGPMAETALRNYFVDKLFIGVDGIDSNYGISTPNIEEAYLNRVMIDISKEVIVVTDSSKFKQKSFAHISPISAIHTVITDNNIRTDEYDNLLKSGIKVITVS